MKVLFMGSPDFAVGSLEALLNAGIEVVGVVSQPDKPKGRGYNFVPTAVKTFAVENNLSVYTPQSLKNGELLPILEELKPDCIAVVAYGKILPEYILNYPKYGCINVHASLLPKYRGAAPINFAIINGETKTGITTMYMDKGLDTGDMLLKSETEIFPDDNAESLHDRLAEMGAGLLVETLNGLEKGIIIPEKQEGESSYAPLIDNKVRLLDLNCNSKDIINKIRGLSPVPCAYIINNGKNIKILKAENVNDSYKSDKKVGTLLSEKELVIKTGDGAIKITELAPEGKKKMSGSDFLRGIQNKDDFGFFG